MEMFISQKIDEGIFELKIDTDIFPKNIILKSAFSFLDKGYFFFKKGEKDEIILQFTPKGGVEENPRNIIGEFSDSLLEMTLRDKLEKENKVIREAIVTKAINGPIDQQNFVTLDTDLGYQVGPKNIHDQVNSNKDIDEILKEIENDPELEIDEEEINEILREIEKESEFQKPEISANLEGLKKVKSQFIQKK